MALKGSGSIANSAYVAFAGVAPGGSTLDISQTTSGASVGGLFDPGGNGVVSLGGKTLTITNGSFFNGVIQDGGIGSGTGGSLVIAGGASQALGGVNTYTGSTTIMAGGTLSLSSLGSIASSSGLNLTGSGATFDISGNSGNQTIKDLSGVAGSMIQLGANSLTVGTANSTSFAGSVEGSGGLTKIGTGTLTLSGANAYSGGTIVNAGTLQISGAGTLGASGGATTINGGTLDLGGTTQTQNGGLTLTGGTLQNGTLSSSGTFDMRAGSVSAALAGTGPLQKTTTDTVTLSGANTYSGATSVSAGTLQAGALNSFSSSSAFSVASGATLGLNNFSQTIGSLAGAGSVTLGSATLATGNDNTSTTFSGTISGAGGLTKIGTGTLTLSGANSYSGGTTIAGGTLSLANNQALGTGALTTTGSVVDYANGVSIANAIIINSNTTQLSVTTGSATQAGAISELNGPRPLEKIGAGTLVLSGISTYSGPTTISGGALVVTGSIANSALTIGSGATLTGTGTVGATTIASGGTFAPGPTGTPGSMTINGNLAFQSGAIYVVQVNPANASSANAIAGGSASLAGTVQAAFASGSYVTRNYTILSAAGGLSGTFGGLSTSNLPAGFTANLGYTANSVILNLTATLGQPPAPSGPTEPTGPTGPGALRTTTLSGNQLGIANALNAFFNNGGALPPSFVSIFGLTGGTLANALTSLSGEAATGAQQAGFQMGSQFLSLMLDPFVDGRSGIAGAGAPALGFAPEQALVSEQVALAYASVLKEPKVAAVPLYEPRWTAWGGAYGGGNKTSGDPAVLGSHDLSATAAGFAAGLDYRVSPNSVVGLALAGGGTGWGLAQGLGGGKSDAFQAGLYGATKYGPAYLAAAFALTNHWMSTDRLAFAGDHLTASFNAQSYGGRLEGGYRFGTPYGGVTPYAAIQAQSFHTPGYSESGVIANGFALAFNGRDATDTRSELGARFDRALALYTNAVLSFRGRLAWAHDWVSDPSLTPLFQTLPGASFVVNGATPAKDSVLTTAGAEYRLANGVTLLAKFDGEFASHSSTYAGTGTVRYAW